MNDEPLSTRLAIADGARLVAERDAERLRASFDAHHPPNLQEGFRCNVCGEEHPYALANNKAK